MLWDFFGTEEVCDDMIIGITHKKKLFSSQVIKAVKFKANTHFQAKN